MERRENRRSYIKGKLEQMFLGRYHHTVDEKGRLTVPARYRDLLAAEGAYLTQGFDSNINVYPIPIFERISLRVNRLSMTDPSARLLRRLMFSNAELVVLDKAGRILVPHFLREGLNLDSEAVIVGMGDYFEIWSPNQWVGQTAMMEESEPIAVRFMDLDLSTGE
ncbi:MAG: division/cell wall cluster transcriptional repressor MraZ [Anaerolineales bacterium]|nr:division/cell wall cluster transcriptional repressor MraZ [Anaerolineales bacterium]HUV25951.1 division/cell wall cluster transcriptional repressor MraZ [Anaerolineales bacterium]